MLGRGFGVLGFWGFGDRKYNRYSRFTPQIVLKYFEQIYPYIKN